MQLDKIKRDKQMSNLTHWVINPSVNLSICPKHLEYQMVIIITPPRKERTHVGN